MSRGSILTVELANIAGALISSPVLLVLQKRFPASAPLLLNPYRGRSCHIGCG